MASQAMGIWDTIWGDFARYFTVANFDLQGLPGARRRDAPGEGFRLLAENCVQVATFLGFEKFHIFGWNGGTQIAMRCAVNFADHIQSCILLDPFFELADMRKMNKAIEFKGVLFEHPQRELYAYYWVMATELDNWHAGPSVSMAREVCARIPSAELKIIDGFGGHFLVEDPAKFMEIAEPFIRSVVA